ncbi:membrane protein [Gammaproteobacteria bacterium]|nr:membrane protein [Gammaproteobacteria bacterium]
MVFKRLFKKQLSSVIEWTSQNHDDLFYQIETPTSEIKNASKLILNPGQGVILVYEGKIQDVLVEQGIYLLETDNHPFITNLLKIRQSFESEHKMHIYFFRKAEIVSQKWGTSTPIKYVDSVYNFPIELGAYGSYSLKIDQAKAFFENIVGSKKSYTQRDMQQLLSTRITPEISSSLAQSGYSYQQIDARLSDLSLQLKERLNQLFYDLGLVLTDFRIEATSFNEETQNRINKIADMTAEAKSASEVGLDYVELEKLRALRDAAKNEGGLAGAGLQIGAGLELAKSISDKNMQPKETTTAPVVVSIDNHIEQLKKLKSLLDEQILTQEEFDAKKKEILSRI